MTETREYSFTLARVDSPTRAMVVITYEDGTVGDQTPKFDSSAEVRDAVARAAKSWSNTKSGARFLKKNKDRLTAENLQELLDSSATRASFIAELKKQGFTKISAIVYSEIDIAKDWASDLDLIG